MTDTKKILEKHQAGAAAGASPAVYQDYRDTGFGTLRLEEGVPRLAETLGLPAQSFSYQELCGGTFNKVMVLQQNGQPQFVCKISPRWNVGGLERERWCYDVLAHCRSFRLPEVILYQSDADSCLPGHEVLVLEYVPGRILDPEGLAQPGIQASLTSALREIHERKVSGYGWLTAAHQGRHSSWRAFLKSVDNFEVVRSAHILRDEELEEALQGLDQLDFTQEASLLHGDLNPSNVLVSQAGNLTLIDLQNCFAGDPLYDLGIGLFFAPEFEGLIEDPGGIHSPGITRRQATIRYAMRHSLGALGHRVQVEDALGTQRAQRRFRELKAQW